MCLSPVSIENPNYGSKSRFAQFKDTVSRRIYVPCGVCAECIAWRQMQWVQRLQMEEIANHLFFCTLTYNNEFLPRVSTSTGYDLRFADVSDVQKMFKRLRKRNAFGRPFRYFGVSELGSKRGRPHFHILFIVPKYEGDTFGDCLTLEKKLFDEVLFEWRRNYGSRKFPDYKPLCTYVRKFVRGKLRTNFDLHYVNPVMSDGGSADVCFYVLKYMLKPSDRTVRLRQALHLNLSEEEYEDVWSLVKPRHFESECLGLGRSDICGYDGFNNGVGISLKRVYSPDPRVLSYLRKSIDLSKKLDEPVPSVISPDSGKFSPLARYYKTRPEVFSLDDYFDFFYGSKKARPDNVVIPDYDHVSQIVKKIDDFDDKKVGVDFNQTANELDELFEPLDDNFIDL